MVLKSLRVGNIFNFSMITFNDTSNSFQIRAEKFFPKVDLIQPSFMQCLMKSGFEGRSVIRRNHHMNVERKWNRSGA